MFSSPSIQSLHTYLCFLWLPARPAPSLSGIWKSTRMSTTGPRLWTVELSKLRGKILSIKICCFYWHLDRAFSIKKAFWCLHTIIIIIWTIIDIIFDIQQNKTWCPWMREVCLGLREEGIILVGRAHFCLEDLPYCTFYQRRRTESACPYFSPPGFKNGQRWSRLQIHSL